MALAMPWPTSEAEDWAVRQSPWLAARPARTHKVKVHKRPLDRAPRFSIAAKYERDGEVDRAREILAL